MEPALWRAEKYLDFLAARRELLAAETNLRMGDLLHGDKRWLAGHPSPIPSATVVGVGITGEDEESELMALNDWVARLWLASRRTRLRLHRPGDARAVRSLRFGVA